MIQLRPFHIRFPLLGKPRISAAMARFQILKRAGPRPAGASNWGEAAHCQHRPWQHAQGRYFTDRRNQRSRPGSSSRPISLRHCGEYAEPRNRISRIDQAQPVLYFPAPVGAREQYRHDATAPLNRMFNRHGRCRAEWCIDHRDPAAFTGSSTCSTEINVEVLGLRASARAKSVFRRRRRRFPSRPLTALPQRYRPFTPTRTSPMRPRP